jgi:hypothetical protein
MTQGGTSFGRQRLRLLHRPCCLHFNQRRPSLKQATGLLLSGKGSPGADQMPPGEVFRLVLGKLTNCPEKAGGLKGSTQHFILEGRDGVDAMEQGYVRGFDAAHARSATAKPLHAALARRALLRLDTMATSHPRPLAVPRPELPRLCPARLPRWDRGIRRVKIRRPSAPPGGPATAATHEHTYSIRTGIAIPRAAQPERSVMTTAMLVLVWCLSASRFRDIAAVANRACHRRDLDGGASGQTR